MASTEAEDFDSLWLKPFTSSNPEIQIMGYVGGGAAGYVFKVRVNHQIYALKMARVYYP